MKKYLFFVGALLLTVVLLSGGCGGSSNSGNTQGEIPEQEEIPGGGGSAIDKSAVLGTWKGSGGSGSGSGFGQSINLTAKSFLFRVYEVPAASSGTAKVMLIGESINADTGETAFNPDWSDGSGESSPKKTEVEASKSGDTWTFTFPASVGTLIITLRLTSNTTAYGSVSLSAADMSGKVSDIPVTKQE